MSSDKDNWKQGEVVYCAAVLVTVFLMMTAAILGKGNEFMAGVALSLGVFLAALCPIGIAMQISYGIRHVKLVVLICFLLASYMSTMVVYNLLHMSSSAQR